MGQAPPTSELGTFRGLARSWRRGGLYLPREAQRTGAGALPPNLDRREQAHVGSVIRTVYQGTVDETLPERIRSLLDMLERSCAKTSAPKHESIPCRRDHRGA